MSTGITANCWLYCLAALLEFEEVPAPSSASVGSTPDAVSETGSAGLDETRSAAAAAAAARQGRLAALAPSWTPAPATHPPVNLPHPHGLTVPTRSVTVPAPPAPGLEPAHTHTAPPLWSLCAAACLLRRACIALPCASLVRLVYLSSVVRRAADVWSMGFSLCCSQSLSLSLRVSVCLCVGVIAPSPSLLDVRVPGRRVTPFRAVTGVDRVGSYGRRRRRRRRRRG